MFVSGPPLTNRLIELSSFNLQVIAPSSLLVLVKNDCGLIGGNSAKPKKVYRLVPPLSEH